MKNSQSNIRSRVTQVLREAFNQSDLALAEVITAHDVRDRDSLKKLHVVIAAESVVELRRNTANINSRRSISE